MNHIKRTLIIAVAVALALAAWCASAGAQSGSAAGAADNAATGRAGTGETAAPQEAPVQVQVQVEGQVPETYAELKALYLSSLDRITELETALQEAIDLARGYRSDWAEERAVAEARKTQTEQVLDMAKTLQDLIREMKDIINKQHEIIMKLTTVKQTSIGFTAGVSLQRTALAPDRFSYQPGFTVGIIVFP